jgi:thioredoxin-related protein
MTRFICLQLTLLIGLCILHGLGQPVHAAAAEHPANGLDSIPRETLVFVEGFDAQGQSMSVSIGVMVKKGYVALNYHYLVGASSVSVFKPGEAQRYASDGYLSVEERQDLIVISVPELSGKYAVISDLDFPKEGATVQLTASADQRRLQFANAVVHGNKDIDGVIMPQMVSTTMDECTGGPIFQSGKVVGFTLAGYLDENRYYAYGVPAYQVKRLLTRSFIIKTYTSFSDLAPMAVTPYQGILMESLESVLWKPVQEAERMARNKGKMLFIDVSTKWAGWSNLMEKNTYSKKSIIRYLNENFLAVKLDAETTDTITFNEQAYTRNSGSLYHSLAYSLLEGNMQFPSTVILDDEVNELLVIPGYMDAHKMEVVLHYFYEEAYKTPGQSFQQYEQRYWEGQVKVEDK